MAPQIEHFVNEGLGHSSYLVDPRLGHRLVIDVELGALADARVSEGPVATMCGKTERAMTGASVLERRGHPGVAVLRGGYNAWTAHRHATVAR